MSHNLQIITNNYYESSDEFSISSFLNYESLNSFKINFIDLNYSEIWNYNFIKLKYDFLENLNPLIKSIENSNNETYFIFSLPQNIPVTTKSSKFQTDYLINNTEIVSIFLKRFAEERLELIYGSTTTNIDEYEFSADFYLKRSGNLENIIINSNGETIAAKYGNFIFTTIHMDSLKTMKSFIEYIAPSYKETEIPDWFSEVRAFDDQKELENIQRYNNEINDLESKIRESEEIFEKNNKYKSILYTKGTALVNVVLEILDEMLNTNLSEFVDVYDEDFYFENEDIGFIGEIKGVNRNLKNEYLNQLNDHAVKKQLKFDEEDVDKKLKQIMIINTFKKHHPNDRPEIEDETVKKAKMYDALVITTPELLKVLELFKKGEIETDEILNRLKEDVGLLQIN